MANLAISAVCNQSCAYCFTVDHLEGRGNGPASETSRSFMPKAELEERLDFLARSGIDEVRFLGGEPYRDFYARIAATMEHIVAEPDWHDLAVFAHGGTNAAILGWVTGLGLDAFGVFDQATCCLNVIDFDVDRETAVVVRKVLRGMNITAADPTKKGRHAGDMEALARYLMSFDRTP